MAKAIGIGGVFLDFNGDKQEVMDWYEANLGLDMTPYGTGFVEGRQYVLLSFSRGDTLGEPYLNFRVDDIETLITNFKKQKLEILSGIVEYEYGKFARFKDPFGNAIELWEIYEKPYVEMVKKEVRAYKDKKEIK